MRRNLAASIRVACIVSVTRLFLLLHNICTIFILTPLELAIALLRPLCPPSVFKTPESEREADDEQVDESTEAPVHSDARARKARARAATLPSTSSRPGDDASVSTYPTAPQPTPREDAYLSDSDARSQRLPLPIIEDAGDSPHNRMRRYLRSSFPRSFLPHSRSDPNVSTLSHRRVTSSPISGVGIPLPPSGVATPASSTILPPGRRSTSHSSSTAAQELPPSSPRASDTIILTDKKFSALCQSSFRNLRHSRSGQSDDGDSEHPVSATASSVSSAAVEEVIGEDSQTSRFVRFFQVKSRQPVSEGERNGGSGDESVVFSMKEASSSTSSLGTKLSTAFRSRKQHVPLCEDPEPTRSSSGTLDRVPDDVSSTPGTSSQPESVASSEAAQPLSHAHPLNEDSVSSPSSSFSRRHLRRVIKPPRNPV
ncbi:hypothetical protein BZA70DRAFT_273112 [Myxozyma melibiosi]|uniref:Uncharacterized protein n=1 Tax=Myxozyma melibiosi TaxID=54550 RepID=A0ABR1FED2_9ASCO